jgi:hypothetical protein
MKQDYEGVEAAIKAAKNIEEIEDHPELMIELAKLEVLFAAINDDFARAGKLTSSSLRKAVSGDLAMIALELLILADVFRIADKIDKKILAKVNSFFERMQNSMGSGNSTKLIACHRRKVEIIRSFVSSLQQQSPVDKPVATRLD